MESFVNNFVLYVAYTFMGITLAGMAVISITISFLLIKDVIIGGIREIRDETKKRSQD